MNINITNAWLKSKTKVFKIFVLTYCIRLSYYYQNAAREVTLPLRNRSSSHDLGVKTLKYEELRAMN